MADWYIDMMFIKRYPIDKNMRRGRISLNVSTKLPIKTQLNTAMAIERRCIPRTPMNVAQQAKENRINSIDVGDI